MMLDAFLLHGSLQPLSEDGADAASFFVRQDPFAGYPQPIRPDEGSVLSPLIGVLDFGRTKLVGGLVQSLHA